jgi:hypothetical protein
MRRQNITKKKKQKKKPDELIYYLSLNGNKETEVCYILIENKCVYYDNEDSKG